MPPLKNWKNDNLMASRERQPKDLHHQRAVSQDQKPRDTHTPVTELRLLPKDGSSLRLRVNVVPKITGNLQLAYFIQRNAIIYLGTFHLPIQYPQIKKLPT